MTDDILEKATAHYKDAKEAWAEPYLRAKEDLHFLSDAPYCQWDESEASKRTKVGRPTLQIDQLGQFIHQVANDIRMNTPTIKPIPDDNDADEETAEIYGGLIKAIEYKSNADVAYDTAADFSVKSSIGFIRVDHDYSTIDGFEQELQIKRVVNPSAILIDPNSIEPDGSDAMYGFCFDEITKKEFEAQYPKCAAVGFGDDKPSKAVKDSDKIAIAEYFVVSNETIMKGMSHDGSVEDAVKGKTYKQTRKVNKRKILRYKLSGEDVLESTTFPGIYIPLVPVYGEEAWIDGTRHLYSLIRKSKAAQQMYNLWKSLETELLMKQQQAPVQAAVGQMRGFEDDWKTPEKAMVLYYNQTDTSGNQAPPPQRLQPPTIPTGIVNAARETVDDIKATMGMYNASIGVKSNETSGVALESRKKEGDVATFHFGDNLVRSIGHVGKILVFAIPEVYDTARIVKIVGEEEVVKSIGINGAIAEGQERHFDLTKGKYGVRVVTGASFTTQRQEAAQMYNQLIQAMPDLMPVIGDLVFKYQDTPGSKAISERLKKTIDPKLLSDEEKDQNQPDPQVAALNQQLQQAEQIIQQGAQQIQQLEAELKNKQTETQIKQQELGIKSEELQIKKMELLLPEGGQSPKTSAQHMPMSDDTPEVLHAKLQSKLAERDQGVMDAQMKEQQDAMQAQQKAEMEAQELQLKQQDMTLRQQQAEAIINALNQIGQQVHQLNAQVSQPKQVVRDANNVIIGVA